jgi:transcriptional regulator with XRE-family HTH domain
MTPRRYKLVDWTPRRDAVTLSIAVARRVRPLREERRWTQDDLARRVLAFGLEWDRNVVANVERTPPAREVSIAEWAVLLSAFRTDEIAFFGPNHPPIELAPSLVVEPGGITEILTGKAWPSPEEEERLAAALRARRDAVTLVERRAAARLSDVLKRDVRPELLRAASIRLWERTLLEERNLRVAERTAGAGDPKAARRAVTGHVTRELLEALETDPSIRRARRKS